MITATLPYDEGFTADRDEFAFLERAWRTMVEVACPGWDPIVDGDDISYLIGWLSDGPEVGGLRIEVFSRSAAIRLLQAGLLDQTGDELVSYFPLLEGAECQ